MRDPYNNRTCDFEVIRIINAFNIEDDFEKVRKMLSMLKYLRQQAAVEAGISSPFAEDILYKRSSNSSERMWFSMLENYKDVLTVKEVLEVLPIGKNSLYRLLKEEKIKSFRPINKILVLKKDLIEYLTTA